MKKPFFKITLVNEHRLASEGLASLLEKYIPARVTGIYTNGTELIKNLADDDPDMVFADLDMPSFDGVNTIRQIRSINPEIKLAGLSMFNDEHMALEIYQAGALAYISKNISAEEFSYIIQQLYEGKVYLNPELALLYAKNILLPANQDITDKPDISSLQKANFSLRERKILQMMTEGNTHLEMSLVLGVSKKTIEADKKRMKEKMQVKRSAEMLVLAFKRKLLP